jgi:hypothetical protein
LIVEFSAIRAKREFGYRGLSARSACAAGVRGRRPYRPGWRGSKHRWKRRRPGGFPQLRSKGLFICIEDGVRDPRVLGVADRHVWSTWLFDDAVRQGVVVALQIDAGPTDPCVAAFCTGSR